MATVWATFSSFDNDGNEYCVIRPQFLDGLFANKDAVREYWKLLTDDQGEDWKETKVEDHGDTMELHVTWHDGETTLYLVAKEQFLNGA